MKPLVIWSVSTLVVIAITYMVLLLAPGFPFYNKPWNDLFWAPVIGLQLFNAAFGWLILLAILWRMKK